MIRWMALDCLSGLMVGCTKVNGDKERNKVKESITGQMDKSMMVNLKTMNVMVQENSIILMERFLKVFGRMARRLASVAIYGLMVPDTMYSTLMVGSKVKDNLRIVR